MLWEALPSLVMDVVLKQHHACIRKQLLQHKGYESATEGGGWGLWGVGGCSTMRVYACSCYSTKATRVRQEVGVCCVGCVLCVGGLQHKGYESAAEGGECVLWGGGGVGGGCSTRATRARQKKVSVCCVCGGGMRCSGLRE